ncbi:hypothetical protein [Infirmifilum sp. NZ]|uniref:hypothetical protein n=1 Tax=Infirmifilum sp. NZ TaxID=2926850 RepID=UPI00279F8447|nr:hypothetical protein [Infirmifilum sp. NZ]UNQ73971.1 hypothetical protein MOV14_02875 [Infirmifilum sp. NZ]
MRDSERLPFKSAPRPRALLALLLALTSAGGLAAVIIINASLWGVWARESPLVKLGNSSILPVSSASWAPKDGLNVTTYSLRFVPGWVEEYTVGSLAPRLPGLQASLHREASWGSGSYWIYLGGSLQLSTTQSSGPPAPTPASIVWRSQASSTYWVLTTARYTVSTAQVAQYINFSAQPMSLLSSASYSCSAYTRSDDFANACTATQYTFDALPPNSMNYTSGKSQVYLASSIGKPEPSLYTESQQGYAAFFLDYSAQPFSASAPFSLQYYFKASLQDKDYIQLHFFLDTNGDGSPDLEVIYYGSGGGTSPLPLAPVIYGRNLPPVNLSMPGFANKANVWINVSISQVYSTSAVVGLALAAWSQTGVVKAWWDNVSFQRCANPSYIGAYTRGYEYTMVYVDDTRSPSTPPSVATEVDAYASTGNPVSDYGVSAAVYDVASRWGNVPAANFSFTVKGLFAKSGSADANNDVAYVAAGVDTNGDGVADVEYIFYRYLVSSPYSGAIVSVLASPGTVVCTVGSDGSCVPSNPSFKVFSLGALSNNTAFTWSGSLPLNQSGSVVALALSVTDASGNAPGTADDLWVWWDDLTITYRVCTPLPGGWSVSDGTFYRPLVPGAVVYAGSFTGDGGFYLLDSSLQPLLGARRSGSDYYARCGASELYIGSFPGAYWVDVRPLAGLWEVILRDSGGGILARYGCAPAGSPSYVGFMGVEGFEFRAWG